MDNQHSAQSRTQTVNVRVEKKPREEMAFTDRCSEKKRNVQTFVDIKQVVRLCATRNSGN